MRIYFSIHAGDSISHVLRTIQVAKELKKRGNIIKYGSSLWTKPYVHVEDHSLDFVSTNQGVGYSNIAQNTYKKLLDSICKHINTERIVVEEFQPDLIVADPGFSANLLSAKIPKVRILHGLYLHLFKSDMLSKKIRDFTRERIEIVVNSAAKKLKIGDQFEYNDLFKEPVIVPGIEKFETSQKILNAHFIGPFIINPKRSVGNKNTAYLTMGSGNKDPNTLTKLLDLIAPYFQKIYISTGKDIKLNIPPKRHKSEIIISNFFRGIPSDAGTVICHGGHGTVYQALYGRRRIIAIPYNLDQLVQACNLERTNTGLVLVGKIKGLLVKQNFEGITGKLEEPSSLNRLHIGKVNDIKNFADLLEKFSLPQYNNLKKYYTNSGSYTPPAIPKKNTSPLDHYENIRRMYKSSFDYTVSLPSYHTGYDYATKKLLNLAKPHGFSSKKTLLELSCGLGTALIYLGKNYNFNIIGVDLVKQHVEECNRRIINNKLQDKIRVICRNILDLNKDMGGQDIIFSEDSFSHIPDRERLFCMCYRLLKPKGLFVFSDLIKTDRISNLELNKQCKSWCLHSIESYQSYIKLIKKTGFKILQAQNNIGIELLKHHIEIDKKKGDLGPGEYFSIFQSHKADLIKKWGRSAFEIRRERLQTYEYIWEYKLDYAFFVLSK